MWRRPVVTILMLIIAMILTLPLRAQQKVRSAGPARSALRLFHQHVPPWRCPREAQQKPVAPGIGKALYPGAGQQHGAGRIRRRVGRQADRAARD